MFNNLSNFFNLKVLKRFKTVIERDDVIPLGTRDSRYGGGYKPTAMKVSDFLANVGGNSFLTLTDTPVDYTGQAGNVATVNPGEDGLIFSAIPPSVDTNTWDMANVAFVSRTTGNDGTGALGDGNKPYLNINVADTVASIVMILPGTYSETVTLKTGTTYYCYPGVVFTSGGLRAPGTALIDTRWLGHADFIGNFLQIYLIGMTATNLQLEWNTSVETGSTARCFFIDGAGAVTFTAKCRSILSYGGGAYGARMQGTVSGVLNIQESLKGSYGVLNFGTGATVVGNIVVNCPKIIITDGGFVGNNSSYKQCIHVYALALGSTVIVNGDVYDQVSVFLTSVSGSIRHIAAGRLIHNGSIYGTGLYGISITSGTVIQNGNMNIKYRPYLGTGGETLIKNATIVTESYSHVNNVNATLYMKDCSYNNAQVGIAGIRYNHASNKLYIENTTFELEATAECIDTVGVAASAGLINVTSNVINDVALLSNYTAPGFTVEANLNVPKFN